jgi:surface polysaccharide O-acyltransferase-like enzyme
MELMNENIRQNNDQHIEYIDVLRVLSMLSVVFLHTAAGSLRGNLGSSTWHISNVLTAIMSSSVPIFFMISGAMLLSSKKTVSISFTYKKRIPKIIIPFFLWSLAAIAYYAALNFLISGSIGWDMVIGKLRNIASQPTIIHLWFMYALIPIYLLSPILKKLVDALTKNLALYMITIWLVFSSVLPTLVSLIPVKFQSLLVLNSSYDLNLMNGFLGYFLLGFFLFNYDKNISKRLLIAIIIIDTVLISLGTWWVTSQNGVYMELFKGYSRLFVLILSVAVFLLVKELLAGHRLSHKISAVVTVLSSLSFGVYLLHNIIVSLISNIVILSPANSFFVLFTCYIIILLVSVLIMILLASSKLTCFAFTGLNYKNAKQTCNIQYFLSKFHIS